MGENVGDGVGGGVSKHSSSKNRDSMTMGDAPKYKDHSLFVDLGPSFGLVSDSQYLSF